MSVRTRVIVAIAVVMAVLAVTRLVRKKKIEMKYALVWYLLALVVLIIDLFPGLLESMTAFMGVGLAVNMLFFLGFCFSLVILFILTLWVSRLAERGKQLTQEIALLEKEVRDGKK